MTLRDDPRTYKKPVEEGARAILMARYYVGDEEFYHNSEEAFFDVLDPNHFHGAELEAAALFQHWRKCGFISDLGIEAIRAEEAGK